MRMGHATEGPGPAPSLGLPAPLHTDAHTDVAMACEEHTAMPGNRDVVGVDNQAGLSGAASEKAEVKCAAPDQAGAGRETLAQQAMRLGVQAAAASEHGL